MGVGPTFIFAKTMANALIVPSTKTIVLVGLAGCLLTSVAGVSGAMLISGWELSGGWSEWARRLGLGYPCGAVGISSLGAEDDSFS